jgi:hypothetical protein
LITAQTSNPRTLKMTMIAGCVQMGPGTLTRSESERERQCVETSGEGERFLAQERRLLPARARERVAASTGEASRRGKEWIILGKPKRVATL